MGIGPVTVSLNRIVILVQYSAGLRMRITVKNKKE